MGQVALGFRSLLIKLSIFVVLAGLLAWALGGELWPKPRTALLDSVTCYGDEWSWQAVIGTDDPRDHHWQFVRQTDARKPVVVGGIAWSHRRGPLLANGSMFVGGLSTRQFADEATPSLVQPDQWSLLEFRNAAGTRTQEPDIHRYDTRFDLERQLARLEAGLPLQDPETSAADRAAALDPSAGSTDTDVDG